MEWGRLPPLLTMKAIKDFDYYLNGNVKARIQDGDDIPEVAQEFAIKNGFAEKAKPAPQNKAKRKPQAKAK